MRDGCFRGKSKCCTWCVFAEPEKRAKYRCRDKAKSPKARKRLKISLDEFVEWYKDQKDCCAYCGLAFSELKKLAIQRGSNYCIAWDIDRIDPTGNYEKGNMVLSCFVCNMAKGDILTAEQARRVGRIIRKMWKTRLAALQS